MNPNKDNLDSFANKFEFKGYQYKALAILLSSFENVLLLDSDNIPAHSPEELFENDPFKSYGLVVWPDYWKRATSPYYNIADIDVSENIWVVSTMKWKDNTLIYQLRKDQLN